ncbi:MAG: DUF4097 family beta strand repeat protein [Gemmatimonadales bacterium]|nr:DUF4097 family beta strand repeat protein [Gemmatimonadales bacterium]
MITILALAGLAGAASIQSRAVDTTIAYTPGATILVINPSGKTVIRGADRSDIRIRATPPQGDRIDIDRRGGLQIQRVVAGIPANAGPMLFELDVPRGAPIDLLGQRTEVSVVGVLARIAVNSREGNIVIRGGRGVVKARTISGSVTVTGADGALDLRSTSEAVTVDSSRGDLTAETRSGNIVTPLDGFRSVKATSLSGAILLRGVPSREGAVAASSHSGDITLAIPAGANAEIRAGTTDGSIKWRVPGAPAGTATESRLILGSGGGSIDLRSFGGTVRIGPTP